MSGSRDGGGRTLTVLNVAYPLAPVGPDAVGGAEQIVSALDKGLLGAGHRSLVLACEGSQVDGKLFATPLPVGPLTAERQAEAHTRYRADIERIVARERVDLVHLHGADFYTYLPRAAVPVLATLHLPPDWYPGSIFQLERLHTYLHCVSNAQRRCCPASPRLLDDVPNGVDLTRFGPRGARGEYALVLGRVCPEKGIHVALDAAKRADVELLIAGEVFPYPAHLSYFEQEIAPRLDARRRFVGPLAKSAKADTLARARCLVLPSLVSETSSLAAMEALASGTPVVAFRRGAPCELIVEGVTGHLVDDVPQMADAIGRAATLSSRACRTSAEAFSVDAMLERYLRMYRRVALPVSAAPYPAAHTSWGQA
jgi:glycosyltransferase involved in cell wall biosynthesis